MKTDTRIIISTDKQFYSDGDEIKIHMWFNKQFHSEATLSVLSPSKKMVDSAVLKINKDTTETFALTCGGADMFESGYYTIRVECDGVKSETMFEYFHSVKKSHDNWRKQFR